MIYGKMVHSSHPDHKLKLEGGGAPYKCNGCREVGFGSRFTCQEVECDFHLHKCCASPRFSISHPFFKNCHFKFLEVGGPNRLCDACGDDINGFVYHCDRGYDLHPCCAKLEPALRVEAGDEILKLVLRKKVNSKCHRCGKRRLSTNGGSRNTWSYVSTCKEYHFHISCVKEMLLDSCEKDCWGDANEEGAAAAGALVPERWTTPKLQITSTSRSPKKKGGKFGKYARLAKLALTFIIAALFGDPISLAAGLITSLVTQ